MACRSLRPPQSALACHAGLLLLVERKPAELWEMSPMDSTDYRRLVQVSQEFLWVPCIPCTCGFSHAVEKALRHDPPKRLCEEPDLTCDRLVPNDPRSFAVSRETTAAK